MDRTAWRVQEAAERVPLSERTARRIRALIREEVFRPGDRLPSEPEFAERLGVSRATVRAALAELTAGMVLARRRGVGTFVRQAAPVLSHGLERLIGTGESIAQLGMDPASVEITIDHVAADAALAERFDLGLGTRLVRIVRTRTADGRRVLHCDEWVPVRLLPIPETLDDFGPSDSLYERLDRAGIAVDTALSKVIPQLAGGRVGAKLRVDPGTPIVLLRQIHYGASRADTPVLYTDNFYNSELIDLHAIRRR